jgi:hypothetical protein
VEKLAVVPDLNIEPAGLVDCWKWWLGGWIACMTEGAENFMEGDRWSAKCPGYSAAEDDDRLKLGEFALRDRRWPGR